MSAAGRMDARVRLSPCTSTSRSEDNGVERAGSELAALHLLEHTGRFAGVVGRRWPRGVDGRIVCLVARLVLRDGFGGVLPGEREDFLVVHGFGGESVLKFREGRPWWKRRHAIASSSAARPGAGSRVTVLASLSSRVPRNTGCLSSPSAVHSLNLTSTTSVGRTQCAGSLGLGGFANGDVLRSNFASCACTSRSDWWSNPPPTWPA